MTNPIKIIVIGDFSVGKTSITRRYVSGAFSENYRATVGAAILTQKVQTEAGEQKLVLFDLEGGVDRLEKLRGYMTGAQGAIVVADVTQQSSIDNIATYAFFVRSVLPGCPLGFALNKVDLCSLPEAASKIADALATQFDLHGSASRSSAVLTSALSGEGLDGLFDAVLERLGSAPLVPNGEGVVT